MDEKQSDLKSFLKFFIPGILLVSCVFGFYAWTQLRGPVQLGNFGKVPPFNFQESSGKDFDSSRLEGKVWLASFILTQCPGPCPLETHYLKGLQDKLKGIPDFNMVSCTVNPDYDTPKVLAQYADKLGANRESWFFLTGKKNDLYGLAQNGFKVNTLEDHSKALPEFIHTTKVVLVDRRGDIRGYYDSLLPEDQKRLESDLGKFLRSAD